MGPDARFMSVFDQIVLDWQSDKEASSTVARTNVVQPRRRQICGRILSEVSKGEHHGRSPLARGRGALYQLLK